MPQNGTDSVRPVPQWALDKANEAQEADGRLDERFASLLVETRAAALEDARRAAEAVRLRYARERDINGRENSDNVDIVIWRCQDAMKRLIDKEPAS